MTNSDEPKSDEPAWVQNIDWLTPEEIEDLRREAKKTTAYAQKVFAHLRPKPGTKG
jgi:hypothetical protein